MENDLKNKDSAAYKAKLKLATEAFEKGCFIFSQDTKNLYTPREFMLSMERIQTKEYAQQDYPNMTLFHVDHLVKSKLQALRKAQEDYNLFMSKVMQGFDLRPRELPKKRK